MPTLQLSRPATVTLDGSGNGSVQLGPAIPGEMWQPTSVNVASTGSAPSGLATVTIYAGPAASQPYFVDATYQVLGAASSVIAGQVIHPGSWVWAVFAGCNAHASATLVVNGTRQVP